jgi:DNA (cytosine-5)-methyltransferase 1
MLPPQIFPQIPLVKTVNTHSTLPLSLHLCKILLLKYVLTVLTFSQTIGQMVRAYYNEIEPYVAEWLRNLIKAGEIAPGDVDERDIRDVTPAELTGYDQCHFFAGIGGWSRALRLAGWPDDRPVWTGSCPCQGFSTAGRQKGFEDERHLWPLWFKLIEVVRPPVIFGEQVASKLALDWYDLVKSDLNSIGYAVVAADLPASAVGAFHIRQRLWFVGERT